MRSSIRCFEVKSVAVRITDPKDIKRLLAKGMLSESQAELSLKGLKAQKGNQRKSSAGAIQSLVSALVPENPADILYQSLVRRYGRYYEGGLVVYELEFSFDGRRWRMDVAIPIFKLVLELDGWVDHGRRLSGFKRDREKLLCFERRGWRVVHFSSSQVKFGLEDTLKAIEDIISHCSRQDVVQFDIVKTGFNRSKYVER